MNIDDALRSKVHKKIIAFFHENQASIDTPRGVSTWVAENREVVKRALEDLVEIDVLTAHRSTSTTGYSYTRDSKLILKIDKFLKLNPS